MIPRFERYRKSDQATPEEHRVLLQVRRELLDAACSSEALQAHVPVSWRTGWRCTINVLGRDVDGSLRASVYAQRPSGTIAKHRNVRLVSKKRLPWSLGRE